MMMADGYARKREFSFAGRPMTVLGIGVDLVHVPRIAALLARRSPRHFARKVLSQKELQEWDGLQLDAAQKTRFLAVRSVGGCSALHVLSKS